MLVTNAIAGYKYVDFGNIKLAFTQVCQDELFEDVYFAANTLYYVQSGMADLISDGKHMRVSLGETVLIKQHSKLNIQKYKDLDGSDFSSVILYLFPDFVSEYLKSIRARSAAGTEAFNDIISLGKQQQFQHFCNSLLPLFSNRVQQRRAIKEKTFEAIALLSSHNADFNTFLLKNARPLKIDLYEFMIHNILSGYSLSQLSRLTGRSVAAFKRDFREVFGNAPHQWILGKKMDYAEQLLRSGQMKVSDIYFKLGFNEVSHFSAAFKKVKGISPSKFYGIDL